MAAAVPQTCGAARSRTDLRHCGAPARLYPCGWRCNRHTPAADRARLAARAATTSTDTRKAQPA